MMDIDNIDYAILKVVHDNDKPLWKNRIHEVLDQRMNDFPHAEPVSVQTVGRRVDKLRDEDYLASCIISPEEIKRDLIIAFKLTDNGLEALNTTQERLLKQTVQNRVFANDFDDTKDSTLNQTALVELIRSHFDLNPEIKHRLNEAYTYDELTTFLTLYYVKREVTDVFTDESAEKLAELAERSEAIESAFGGNLLEDKLSEKQDLSNM